LINEIIVRPLGKKFQILGGHDRYNSMKKLGYKKIPCKIKDCSDEEAIDIAIMDNMRKEYNKLDLGRVLAERKKIYLKDHPKAQVPGGNKNEQTDQGFVEWYSEKTGLSRDKIFKALKFHNDLHPEVKSKFGNQILSSETTSMICRLPKNQQPNICKIAEDKKLKSEEVKILVEKVEDGKVVDNSSADIVLKVRKSYERAVEIVRELTKIIQSQNILAIDEDEKKELLDLLDKLQPAMTKVITIFRK
jgi:ParB family chromosome partitioning protein